MIDDNLVDIQTRLAYQEDMLNQLNQVISKQDRTIIQLQAQVEELAKKMHQYDFPEQNESNTEVDAPPPHY